MEMLEVGIEEVMQMSSFKVRWSLAASLGLFSRHSPPVLLSFRLCLEPDHQVISWFNPALSLLSCLTA